MTDSERNMELLDGVDHTHLGDWQDSDSFFPTKSVDGKVRKVICRYGRGCTHILDQIHRDRFWHPPAPVINGK